MLKTLLQKERKKPECNAFNHLKVLRAGIRGKIEQLKTEERTI